MEHLDAVVIGAGVVGLAVARALALAGREVVVLEAADAIGTETSSRNSEVIHAGIYYPPGSLKARFCVAGKHALYRYCDERGIPYRRCGKLLVATAENQLPKLHAIRQQAEANGVTDLRPLTAAEAHALEPELRCVAAYLSPSTGVVDSHAFMLALQGDAESHGAMVAFKSPVAGGAVRDDGIEIATGGDGTVARARPDGGELRRAPRAARRRLARGLPARARAADLLRQGQLLLARRQVALLAARLPDAERSRARGAHHDRPRRPGALRPRRGVDRRDRLRRRSAPRGQLLRRHPRVLAGLQDGRLAPGYSGIRPKIVGPKDKAADFVVQGPREHGVPGLVNLFGIESPGLTCALAIAERVREVLSASRQSRANAAGRRPE